MKKMKTKSPRRPSWLKAIAEAARQQNLPLPSFTGHAMGGARTVSVADGRFVTFKRRLVPEAQAAIDGIEWGLWREQDDLPERIAAFRESLEPNQEDVSKALSLIKGWLLDGWTLAEVNVAVGTHPRRQPVENLPASGSEQRTGGSQTASNLSQTEKSS
jgi:hypothetical protein